MRRRVLPPNSVTVSTEGGNDESAPRLSARWPARSRPTGSVSAATPNSPGPDRAQGRYAAHAHGPGPCPTRGSASPATRLRRPSSDNLRPARPQAYSPQPGYGHPSPQYPARLPPGYGQPQQPGYGAHRAMGNRSNPATARLRGTVCPPAAMCRPARRLTVRRPVAQATASRVPSPEDSGPRRGKSRAPCSRAWRRRVLLSGLTPGPRKPRFRNAVMTFLLPVILLVATIVVAIVLGIAAALAQSAALGLLVAAIYVVGVLLATASAASVSCGCWASSMASPIRERRPGGRCSSPSTTSISHWSSSRLRSRARSNASCCRADSKHRPLPVLVPLRARRRPE